MAASRAGPGLRRTAAGGKHRKRTGVIDAAADSARWTAPLTRRTIKWSLAYIAFLGYILAIVTYALPIGEPAMIVALVALMLQRGKVRLPPGLLLFGAFIAWCALGAVQSPYSDATSETLILLVQLWLIAFVAVNVLRHPTRLRFFMVFFVACFALYPARGAIFNYFLAGYTVFGRALWNHIYANPNDLAALCLLPLSLAAGLSRTEPRGLFRTGAIAAVAVLPVLILLTQSRGAFLGMSIAATIMLFRLKSAFRSVGVLAVILALAVLVLPDSAWDRLQSVTQLSGGTEAVGEMDSSAQQRFDILKAAIRIGRDHPITGVGVGAYHEAHFDHALTHPGTPSGRRSAHNTYLAIFAETGIPGLGLFLGLLGFTFVQAELARRRAHRSFPAKAHILLFLELGLMAYLVAGLFGSFGLVSFLYLHQALLWTVSDMQPVRLTVSRGRARLGRPVRHAGARAGRLRYGS